MTEYIVEIRDPVTGSFDAKHSIAVPDPVSFEAALGFDPRTCLDAGAGYHLTRRDVRWLVRILGLTQPEQDATGYFRGRASYDDLPYELHKGRELRLMLAGKKPMAVFTQDKGMSLTSVLDGQHFTRYVRTGQLVHRSCKHVPAPGYSYTAVYYALPQEAWRIPAHELLLDELHKGRWSPALERLQGALLGYTDAENDIHLQRQAAGGRSGASAAADGNAASGVLV